MSSCHHCGNRDYLCQRCKMEALEDRHGTPADQDPEHWVLNDGIWHAAAEFDGHVHGCLCNVDLETPVRRITQDLRYVPAKYDAPVCRECAAALEGLRRETIPDNAIFERASELVTDGGKSEANLVERAVREAVDLIDAGDSERVAIDYVVAEQGIEHRRDDVLDRVRNQRRGQLVTDGGHTLQGREAFLAGEAHWCDICSQAFDRIDELANHDCRPVRTDGGRDQDDEYYVVDEDRGAVVAGPFDETNAAAEDARNRGPGHIVATAGSLELIALTSNTTIRWETDDVDVVTDGGIDIGAVREVADYWIRSRSTTGGRAIHIPSRASTRDDPKTPCQYSARSKQFRAFDLEHFGDADLEAYLCSGCAAIVTEDDLNTAYGRTPGDVLDEAGLEPDDDDDDATPIAVPDGGHPQHRATCEDCAWSYQDSDLVDVSDEMERHARKEMHDVALERAVATDGGRVQSSAVMEQKFLLLPQGSGERCSPVMSGGFVPDVGDYTPGTSHDCIPECHKNPSKWQVLPVILTTVHRSLRLGIDRELRTDGSGQADDRDMVGKIDEVCSTLEALQADADNSEVEAALRSAVGHAWRASVLQRIDENTDVRMIVDTGDTGAVVRGPDPVAYEREWGE